MTGFWESLSAGVVSGLVATFLTFFFRNVWLKNIIPWYEKRVYKDARIEGRWTGVVKYSEDDVDD